MELVQRLKTIIKHVTLKKITLWYFVNLEIAEKSHFDRKKNVTNIIKKSFALRNSSTKGDLWENPLFSAKK